MAVETGEISARIQRFENACRQSGIKLTHQRMEIFRELARSDEHPDVETIYRRVKPRIPAISLDTVYRTLRMLVDKGLIATVGVLNERQRFDPNIRPHHHFVCTKCGLVRDFYNADFDHFRLPAGMESIGNVVSTHVELRGLCADCKL